MLSSVIFIISITHGIQTLKLTLIHANDIHSHFEEVNINTATCKEDDRIRGQCYGGVARMATYVRKIRKQDPDTMFLNAGDFYQGTMWYSIFKYQPVIEFSNLLNYTVGSLGNHDWDDSDDGLQPFVDQANFPLLAANLHSTSVSNVRKSVVVKVKDKYVGIIGFITPQTQNISNPGPENYFADIICSVRTEAMSLKSIGVDIIIAVGHAGYTLDMELARQVEDLDLVVGGHSHTFLFTGPQPPSVEQPEGDYPTFITQSSGRVVPVVQVYCYTKYIGHLEMDFDDDGELLKPVRDNGVMFAQPILLDNAIEKDEWIEYKLAKYKSILKPYKEVVGSTEVYLYRNDNHESNLGNLVTDSMLASWSEAQVRQFKHML